MKNIFIIGASAKEYALAKKLIQSDDVEKIYVAPGNDAMKEFCTCVDIRENNIQELLEFVMENEVDLTIASSEAAIKADIATEFQRNGLMIFAPSAESAEISLYKSVGKKFMYKLRIPSAKFGIFDKPSMALDYARNSRMPIVVKTDEHQGSRGTLVCSAYSVAKSFIEDIFVSGDKKVLVEDFVLGHEFSFYVITDGYHALPMGAVANYKFSLDGDGGLLTSGMGSYAPDYKVSKQIEQRIMNNVIFPTLNTLADSHTPYVGILGLDCVLTPEGHVVALEFNTFFQEHDCQSILALLDENLFKLIEACTIGSFADDYNNIDIADEFAVSCVLSSGKKSGAVISGLDKLDDDTLVAHFNTKKNQYMEFETRGDRTLIVTKTAKTLSRAKERLYDEVSIIEFDGKKHRKDICLIVE